MISRREADLDRSQNSSV